MREDAIIAPPEDFAALKRRLIEIEPNLPKRLRQAAAYALEHPEEFALGTASALARNADVQASTLVRFAQTLGFTGFSDLQEVFRAHLRNRWPEYSERLRALQQNARDSGDPSHLLVGFADFGGGLDRAAARGRPGTRNRPGGRAPGARPHDPLPRPAPLFLRGPLSDLCARAAWRSGVAHRQCRGPRSRAARARRLTRRAPRRKLFALFSGDDRPRATRPPLRRGDCGRHRQRAEPACGLRGRCSRSGRRATSAPFDRSRRRSASR